MENKQTQQAEERWLGFCDDLNHYYGGEFVDYLLKNLGINKLEGKKHDKAITALHNLFKFERDELNYGVSKDGKIIFKEIDRTAPVRTISM